MIKQLKSRGWHTGYDWPFLRDSGYDWQGIGDSFGRTKLGLCVTAGKLEGVVGRKGVDGTRSNDKLQVMRYNTVAHVIIGCTTSKLNDLCGKVDHWSLWLNDWNQGISTLGIPQEMVDMTDRELETSFGRRRLRFCVAARKLEGVAGRKGTTGDTLVTQINDLGAPW